MLRVYVCVRASYGKVVAECVCVCAPPYSVIHKFQESLRPLMLQVAVQSQQRLRQGITFAINVCFIMSWYYNTQTTIVLSIHASKLTHRMRYQNDAYKYILPVVK